MKPRVETSPVEGHAKPRTRGAPLQPQTHKRYPSEPGYAGDTEGARHPSARRKEAFRLAEGLVKDLAKEDPRDGGGAGSATAGGGRRSVSRLRAASREKKADEAQPSSADDDAADPEQGPSPARSAKRRNTTLAPDLPSPPASQSSFEKKRRTTITCDAKELAGIGLWEEACLRNTLAQHRELRKGVSVRALLVV